MPDAALPLLEDDLGEPGVLDPAAVVPRATDMPTVAVLCFFGELVAQLADRDDVRRICSLRSEAGRNPVYELVTDDSRVAVVQPGIGAPWAVGVAEELVALGVRGVVACGSAGALVPELVLGHAVVVESAVRDEGTSAHYLPAGRVVDADPDVAAMLVAALHAEGAAHLSGRTWTTDAIFRETRARTTRRVAEGCLTVEMEASALIAALRYRGVPFGQVLMSGDSLAGETWEYRGWHAAADARRAVFDAAVSAAHQLARTLADTDPHTDPDTDRADDSGRP